MIQIVLQFLCVWVYLMLSSNQRAYLYFLEPKLSPVQPARDRWGEQHKAPCPDNSSPSFPNVSLCLLFPFPFLLSLEERGTSLLLSPTFHRCLWASAHTHNCFFFFSCLKPRFTAFLPPPPVSFSALPPWWALRVIPGVMDPLQEKRQQTAEVLRSKVPPQCFYAFILYSEEILPSLHTHPPQPTLFLWEKKKKERNALDFCNSSPGVETFMYFNFFFFLSVKNKKNRVVGVGRSMSPPCGSMMKQKQVSYLHS